MPEVSVSLLVHAVWPRLPFVISLLLPNVTEHSKERPRLLPPSPFRTGFKAHGKTTWTTRVLTGNSFCAHDCAKSFQCLIPTNIHSRTEALGLCPLYR